MSNNPYNVKVGQVWKDLDIRSTYAEFTILEIVEDKAIVKRGPRHTRVRLDRFKKAGERGYELVKDVKDPSDRFKYYSANSLTVYGETLQDALNNLYEYPVQLLARMGVNETLNRFIRDWLERHSGEDMTQIFIGWYWRNVDFTGGPMTVGRTETGFIGFMENNKWDYPQRDLTEAEAETVRALLWNAVTGNRVDGDDLLSQLHPFLQSLKV